MSFFEDTLKAKHDKTEKLLKEILGSFSKKDIRKRAKIVTVLSLQEDHFYFDNINFMTIKKVYDNYSFGYDFFCMNRKELEENLKKKEEI